MKAERDSLPSRSRWRGLVLVLAALAVAGFAATRSFIAVITVKNGEFRLTRYPIAEDPWDHPRLNLLRRQEKLDALLSGAATDFEKAIRLRHWAHRQWQSSPQFYYPPWDAVEILDLARRYANHGFCAQYAIVFLQACRAMGLHARYVDLGHFVVAVWLSEQDRWAVMDPTNDIHFERDGVPLRGRELYDAAWNGKTAGIAKVGPGDVRAPVAPADLEPYKSYAILLRNDQLTKPALVVQNGRGRVLRHEDDYTRYPLEGRDRLGYANFKVAWNASGRQADSATEARTDDADDVHDAFDQTIIIVARRDAARGLVKLVLLAENSPEFASFEIRLDRGAFQGVKREVIVTLRPGLNTFTARVRTKAGSVGRESSVSFYYRAGRRLTF